ncbi:Von Willebrand factor type A domain-containing protein [Rhizobium phage RHph_I1_18]|nr:Von Willebrand factor type A domain-containing protein [Rhizobium phage RHph_I1_18]
MTELSPVQIVFSFDTTGSMYPVLQQVRRRIEETFPPLLKETPLLEISLVAHGDYQDKNYGPAYYDTKWLPFTKDLYKLSDFVRTAEPTRGFGNGGECYELMLRQATKIDWKADAKKVLVMIGDEPPHRLNSRENRDKIDFYQEARNLADLGVAVYTIQALSRRESTQYYADLAEITDGCHLTLDQFPDIVELIRAVVYNQESTERLEAYEQEIVSSGRMNRALDRSIGVMKQPRDARGRFVSSRFASTPDGLEPVPAGRFQILTVTDTQDIKGFVVDNSLPFKIGRGFYEFTKKEEIQEKKEVVLRDRKTGDMYTGAQARNMIGLPFGQRGTIKPAELEYDIFVQSTSVNRKLIGGQRFLYEVDLSL